MKAADFANYTPVPSPAQLARLKELGYTKIIVGCSYGSVARPQMQACLDAGFNVEAYAWVSFKNDWQVVLDRALAAVAGLPVKRLWLDCEEEPMSGWDAPSVATQTAVVARIDRAFKYVAAARPDLALGIYTGAWWWRPGTGDYTGFASYPLWSADYRAPTGAPSLYGGWQSVAVWQFADKLAGSDLNADDNLILEEARMYTDAEIDAKVKEALALGVRNQQNIAELANGIDAVSVANNWPLSLKGLWWVAKKAWPF